MLKIKKITIDEKTKKMVKRIAIGAGAVAIVGGAVVLGRVTMEKELTNQILKRLSQSSDGGVLFVLKDGTEIVGHLLNKG